MRGAHQVEAVALRLRCGLLVGQDASGARLGQRRRVQGEDSESAHHQLENTLPGKVIPTPIGRVSPLRVVLDSSGSMKDSDPKRLSALGGMIFADLADPRDVDQHAARRRLVRDAGAPRRIGCIQRVEFLGIIIDSTACVTAVSDTRLAELRSLLSAAVQWPATFYVFDLLLFDDYDLRRLALTERKRLLVELLPTVGPIRVSEHIHGAGEAMFEQLKAMNVEGIVGKRADSKYRGGRSTDWVKVRADQTDDFVVIGLKASKSTRGTFGSLHIAQYDGDRLVYAGSVGTGLTPKHMKEVIARAGETRRERPAIEGLPKKPAAGQSYPLTITRS